MSVYICSDFHGFKSLYNQINNYIGLGDKVVFLGDAADRGPNGWECIKAILDNPRWIYLMGNHEFMLINAVDSKSFHMDYLYQLFNNGGGNTIECYYDDTLSNQEKYIELLSECPLYCEYTNKDGVKIYLSHSGMIREFDDVFNEDVEMFVWDRGHILDSDYNKDLFKNSGYDIIFHGHTPTDSISEDAVPGKAHYYAGGTKCSIDCRTVVSGMCVLLNLDTMEEITFSVSENESRFLYKR